MKFAGTSHISTIFGWVLPIILASIMYTVTSIKTQLKCLFMLICTELIEETRRADFCTQGYFWAGSEKLESWMKIYTYHGVMT